MMEDEKSDKEALLDSVRLVIETACKVIDFPENVSLSLDEQGRTVFTVLLSKPEVGEMEVRYILPEARLAEILERSAIDLYSYLPILEVESAARMGLNARVGVFLRSFVIDIEQNFDNLWDASNLLYEKLDKEGKSIETISREEQTTLVNELADNRRIKAKNVFEKYLTKKNEKTLRWDSLQNIIFYFYDLILPEWKKARQIYKQNKQHAGWRNIVDTATDVHMPIDLLDKLAALDNYESQPSHLAALHAARICLMPAKGRFSSKEPQALKNRISQSRKWMKENPEQSEQLINLVGQKVSFMRTDSLLSKMWRNPDNSLAYEAHVPELSYLDEFYYLTERKQKLNTVMDGVTVNFNHENSD